MNTGGCDHNDCEHHPGQECCPCRHDHADCKGQLQGAYARLGFDVTVSTERPLVRNAFTMPPFVCPHGMDHWVEPTGEQLARWIAERTP
jgi:hypothetical protein